MKRAFFWCVLVLLAGAITASADAEWYEHYLSAREDYASGRCEDAVQELHSATRLKATSAVDQRTYGLQFIDYFPYYYLGLCQLRLGQAADAIQSFNVEENNGAIRARGVFYRDLQVRREEARAEVDRLEQQRLRRLASQRVDELLERSQDLVRAHKLDDALELLAQAQTAAQDLGADAAQRVTVRMERLRQQKRETDEARALAERIESALAQARRSLDQGQPEAASVHFDEVLQMDPHNVAAEAGKREAQALIIAATSQRERQEAFRQGEQLYQAGHYEEALLYLQKAAADSADAQAMTLLRQASVRVDALRRERETKARIDSLLAEGEALMGEQRFAAAQVKFQDVLRLDPNHAHAREREAYAEQRAQTELLDRWRPNQPPTISIFAPPSPTSEVSGQTVSFEGMAADDRGLAKLEFIVEGKTIIELDVPPRADSGEPLRTQAFRRELTLDNRSLDVRVRVTDVVGATSTVEYHVSRKPRLYERRAFFPSVVGGLVGVLGLALGFQRIRRSRAIRQHFNPYIAGAPVADTSLFYGRQRDLQRVLNLLHHNSFMITGERRIGKTSFLLQLRRTLEIDQGGPYRFFPVLIDLQGVREADFFATIMAEIIETLELGPSLRDRLRFSRDRSDYDGRNFSHDLPQVISDLSQRTERSVRLVLLIDEADVLNDYSERTNQLLRGVFMRNFSEHVVTVMSGVGVKHRWDSDVSPWYNFFDQLRLTPFSPAEAEALVREPVAGIFRYEQQAVEKILEYSEMKPYLIQRFCIHAVSRIIDHGRTTVFASDVEAVRDSAHVDHAPHAALGAPDPGVSHERQAVAD
jgi:hypothetical protein